MCIWCRAAVEEGAAFSHSLKKLFIFISISFFSFRVYSMVKLKGSLCSLPGLAVQQLCPPALEGGAGPRSALGSF